jgi:hypothetical protein
MSSVDKELDGFAPYIAVKSKTTPVFPTKGDQVRLSKRIEGRQILDVAQWATCQALQP